MFQRSIIKSKHITDAHKNKRLPRKEQDWTLFFRKCLLHLPLIFYDNYKTGYNIALVLIIVKIREAVPQQKNEWLKPKDSGNELITSVSGTVCTASAYLVLSCDI